MSDLLNIRQDIHATVRVAKVFSENPNNIDSEALSILWFKDTHRSAFEISDTEINSQIEDIKRRVQALKYVVNGVYIDADENDIEEIKSIMYGINRENVYTWEKLENCNLWEEMIHGDPEVAASYQNQNFW